MCSSKRYALAVLVTLPLAATSGLAHEPGKGSAGKASETKASEAPGTDAPVSAEPRQTMATFGDWVMRCERPAEGTPGRATPKRVCEVAQALVIKGQQTPVAQIAFSHAPAERDGAKTSDGSGLTLTVLLPPNVSFGTAPKLVGTNESAAATLTYRRCLPGGCLADARPSAELMKDLRGTGTTGHLSFSDAAGRVLTLPLSFRGLAQALDDFARESGKDAG